MEKKTMAKIVLVHHTRGHNQKTLCVRVISYPENKAQSLLQGDEGKILRAYSVGRYVKKYGGEAENYGDLTEELKRWIERIEENPANKWGGWRGHNVTSTKKLNNEGETKKSSWNLNAREDVRHRITEIAEKRAITTVGLVENILIEWINDNEKSGEKILANNPKSGMVRSWYAGKVASFEESLFGSVDFEKYFYNPGTMMNSLRIQLDKEGKSYPDDIGEIFKNVMDNRAHYTTVEKKNRIYFYAGYCGIDISIFYKVK